MTMFDISMRGFPIISTACALAISSCVIRPGPSAVGTLPSAPAPEPLIAPSTAPAAQSATTVMIAGSSIPEASGLARSSLHADVAWIINDGSAGSTLHAIGIDGSLRAKVSVTGIEMRDAEDLAAFSWRGVPHLLIADVGDNAESAGSYTLHAVPEPDLNAESVDPTWSIVFRYEDGAHNCESVAVDPTTGEALIVTKGKAPQLYTLALNLGEAIGVARSQGAIANTAPGGLSLAATLRGIATGGAATGLDISPDGNTAALLTYSHINLYRRSEGEPWSTAFARRPRTLAFPDLKQAEAVAFAPNSREIWVASEQLPAALARIPIADPR